MADSSIGNLEGKVVIDVSQALTDIGRLTQSLEKLAARIEKMSKAQTIGPSIRNLDQLTKAAQAMETLRGGNPSPAATRAAGGTGTSAEGSLKATIENEDEIGKKIAGSIASALEAQTLDLSVNLKIKNLEELQASGILSSSGTSGSQGTHTAPGGLSSSQQAYMQRQQFRATNEMASALRLISRTSKGVTGEAAVLRSTLEAFVRSINSGAFDDDLGSPIKIEATSVGDQIAEVMGKFFDKAPGVIAGGQGTSKVPLGDVSSFANRTADLDEILDDFRQAVVSKLVTAATRENNDPIKIFSTPTMVDAGPAPTSDRRPASEAERAMPSVEGTSRAFQAALDKVQADALRRRNEIAPPPAATAAATGELNSNPARIVNDKSIAEQRAEAEAMLKTMISSNVTGGGFRDKLKFFEELGSALQGVDLAGGLKAIPAVGDIDDTVLHAWEQKRASLIGSIEAMEAGGGRNPATGREWASDRDRKRGLEAARRELIGMGYTDWDPDEVAKRGGKPRKSGQKVVPRELTGEDRVAVRNALGGGVRDEASVAEFMTRMKDNKDVPMAVRQLEPLVDLIKSGVFNTIGWDRNSKQYYLPQNGVEADLLTSIRGTQRTVQIGGRPIKSVNGSGVLKDLLAHLLGSQVHAATPEAKDKYISNLVDRFFQRPAGGSSLASDWMAAAKDLPSGEFKNSGNYSTGESLQVGARKALELQEVNAAIERLLKPGAKVGQSEMTLLGLGRAGQDRIIKSLADYNGVKVVENKKLPSGARYNKAKNQIEVDDAQLRAMYEARAWTSMSSFADGSKAEDLPADAFTSYEQFRQFALEHEYQHSLNPQRKRGESKGAYETRINNAALEATRPRRDPKTGELLVTRPMVNKGRPTADEAIEMLRQRQARLISEGAGEYVVPATGGGEASRGRIARGEGRAGGGPLEEIAVLRDQIKEFRRQEIQERIRNGELYDPNVFVAAAIEELLKEPADGETKRHRTGRMQAELRANLTGKEGYSSRMFFGDAEGKRIYDEIAKERINLWATADPGPARPGQRAGGYSTVRPQGQNDTRGWRTFVERDADLKDAQTGRQKPGSAKVPTPTTASIEEQELRSRIASGYADIIDRVPIDVLGAPNDSEVTRRQGRSRRGTAGQARAEFARARLYGGKGAYNAQKILDMEVKYKRLTPKQEEKKFGARYQALDADLAKLREIQQAQEDARWILKNASEFRNLPTDPKARNAVVDAYKTKTLNDTTMSDSVKREIIELLGGEASGSRKFGGRTRSGRMPDQLDKILYTDDGTYVSGDDLRDLYAKKSAFPDRRPRTRAEKLRARGIEMGVPAGKFPVLKMLDTPGPAADVVPGRQFAGERVLRVFVTNWPSGFAGSGASSPAYWSAAYPNGSGPAPAGGGKKGGGGGGRKKPPAAAAPPPPASPPPPADPYEKWVDVSPKYELPYTVPPIKMLGPDFSQKGSARLSAAEQVQRQREREEEKQRKQREQEEATAANRVRKSMWKLEHTWTYRARTPDSYQTAPPPMADPIQRREETLRYERLWDRLERQNYRPDRPLTSANEVEENEATRTDRITRAPSEGYWDARVQEQLARQRMQPRSLSTSLVSIFESLNPNRAKTMKAQLQMGDASRRLEQLQNRRYDQFDKYEDTRDRRQQLVRERQEFEDQNPGVPVPEGMLQDIKDAREAEIGYARSIRHTGEAIGKVTGQFIEAKSAASSFGAVVSNLATGAAGGIVAFALGSVVAVAGNALVKSLAAVGPGVERMLGNPELAAKVQKSLGESVAKSGGYGRAAVSGQLAQTGMASATGERLLATLQGRAEGVAAAMQTTAQLDTIKSAKRFDRENQRFGGYDASLFSTTGGLLGTFINGQASLAEQLAEEIMPLTNMPSVIAAKEIPSIQQDWTGITGRYVKAVQPTNQKVEDATAVLDSFIDQVNRSSNGLKVLVDAENKGSAANEELAKSAEQAGVNGEKWAKIIRASGMTVEGVAKGKSSFNELMSAYMEPTIKFPAEFLAGQMEPQLKAQRFSQLAQLQVQTDTVIPQQFAMAQAANPFVGSQFSAAAAIRAIADGTGATLNETKLADLSKTADQIKTEATIGQEAAVDFAYDNLPAAKAKEFADNLGLAKSIGDQIANLRMDSSVKQAILAANQYKESLRQSKIAAQDALGLAGRAERREYNASGSYGNLGTLQRSDFMLGQQSARLGQALSQKQINFQTAIAGFTAPGMTPEERAARIQQAKIEADYAQKQLNIQKQLTENQAKEFQITSARNVTVTAKQVDLMAESQQTAVDVATNEQLIAGLTATLQKPMETVQAGYGTALQAVNDKISGMAQIITNTNDSFKAVTKAMDDMLPAIGKWAAALGIQTAIPTGKQKPATDRPMLAVAGGRMIVNITGNNIGGKDDGREIVQQLVRDLGKQGALLGLRIR